MNPVLRNTLRRTTPRFNRDVVDGFAKKMLAKGPEWIDEQIKSSLTSLSDHIDFQYFGWRKVTPREELNKMILNRTSGVSYDLAVNDVYMIELQFAFKGERFSRHMYLIYCKDGNILSMSGSMYHCVPVLSDKVISPTNSRVFVRLHKVKSTFSAKPRNFIVDGVRVLGNVIHGNLLIVAIGQVVDYIGNPLTSVTLYLTGSMGLKQAIMKYTGASDVKVLQGDVGELALDYIVYESTRIKLRGLKSAGYTGHDVKILVSRDVKKRKLCDNIVYGLIYTLELLPVVADDYVDAFNGSLEDEIMLSRILLGRVIYKDSYSVDRVISDINEHYILLEGYLDEHLKDKLGEIGVHADDVFDLLAGIMEKYEYWTNDSAAYNANIENRYIDFMYYLFSDITIGFNKVILAMNKRMSKSDMSIREVNKIMDKNFSPRKILSLTKSTKMNLAMNGCDCTSDIKYPKITSLLEDQSNGNGVHRSPHKTLPEATKVLNGGDLAFGSLLFLTKTRPTPRGRLNMFVNIDTTTGTILLPENIKRDVKVLSRQLEGREDDT